MRATPIDYIPKQRRSQETRDRLLHATRELLSEVSFEELTVRQISTSAGCSVGNFYQRFPNKEAMIPHLLELHYAELEGRVRHMVVAASDAPLADRVGLVVSLLVEMAVEQRGLIRTLVLRNHQRPESIPAEIRQSAVEILNSVYGFVIGRRNEVRHPRPTQAVAVGLLMVAAAVRERVALVGATQASTLTMDHRSLIHELTRATVAYLEASEGGKR